MHTPYKNCRLCPRKCNVNRTAGELGYCGESSVCRIATACPHFGEEPPFTGKNGSGTIFFSGCSCRCFFCQNYQISLDRYGREMSHKQLFDEAMILVKKGVHNINWVTPDHFLPHIKRLCEALRNNNVEIPFIFNCSGYMLPEMITYISESMDIFLPDMKFSDPNLAKACMEDTAYPEIALSAIKKMVDSKGFLFPWDETGKNMAKQGVLVRHLVLPGQTENSFQVLELLYREFGKQLPLSVMSQFQPTPTCKQKNLFNEHLVMSQYNDVCKYVEKLGFENVFIQPESGDKDYFPDFDKNEAFAGNMKLHHS